MKDKDVNVILVVLDEIKEVRVVTPVVVKV